MNRLALMILKNIFAVPPLWTKLCHYAKNTDKYPEAEKYAHIQKIMQRAVASGNLELVVTGTEKLPAENGYLLCGNHQGLFDVVAIVATHDSPLAGVYAECTNSFAMDREDVRQSLTVIQNVTKELQAGRTYLIFPEGTRSKMGNKMNEFHSGTFRCALKAKAPIVPFAVIDCFKVLDQKGSQPVRVQLHYLDPIPFEEYATMKTTEIAQMVQKRIADVIEANTEAV